MNSCIYFAACLLMPQELPKGHLVAVGGGSTNTAVVKKTLELAGGTKARVLILPQASESSDGERSAALWREHGAASTAVLSLDDKAKAVAAVKQADLIWMPGGDQNRLMKCLNGTGVIEAIRERYNAGATVGGTSAGAAVLSGVMITGGAELNDIKTGGTPTADGLGLWSGAIIDQHFVKRQRMLRLINSVLDRPELVGIGVDESTAAILSGAKVEVLGASQVVVIDGRKAKVTPPRSFTGATIHVLTSGMSWDMTPAK